MNKIKKILIQQRASIIAVVLALMILTPVQVAAGPPSPGCSEAAGCDLVANYVEPTLNLLSGLVGIITVISLITGGIEYSAAEGDPQKSARAKNRIAKTIFALCAYFFVYAFLQFLIPNGLFH